MKECETKLIKGDCLEVMPTLEPGSFDAVICDPPYGITACGWDSVIPFSEHVIVDGKPMYRDEYILRMLFNTYHGETARYWRDVFDEECVPGMWENIKRVLKPNGAVVLFGSQPFTSKLIMSNPGWFKFEWILNKKAVSNVGNAKFQPLRCHESILVFCQGKVTYNPQFEPEKTVKVFGKKSKGNSKIVGAMGDSYERNKGYPKSIIEIMRPNNIVGDGGLHPTQKRLELMEYLVRTHTNPGDRVLDFAAGSGTTLIACDNTGRNGCGIEIEKKYYNIAQQRIKENNVLLVRP